MRLKLLRHAPPLSGGRLAGRRDIDADCSDSTACARMRRMIGDPGRVICSPALRCLQTAAALGLEVTGTSPALWEQDYGDWEGRRYEDLPDLGNLEPERIAAHRPEGGESFDDMAARVRPELQALTDDTLIVAHAGTVRAALSLVVGAAALSFSVAPLSLTIMRRTGRGWAVEAVNLTAEAECLP
ncbi:histidine phosphatase family protein [Paracoccus alkanivorans]|uniref:Histidine phosphatase family protein n=1 Tax=Paracoccus alkanivorans TaxID=2116655 RepID=A0A3M0ML90_9RHOB|nr:histidine phosphatase family protein [Paracoccus alkanivorans]RMC36440.1 histidine phosphatase family protein [Paracoccus alkanivorans]